MEMVITKDGLIYKNKSRILDDLMSEIFEIIVRFRYILFYLLI